MEAAAFKTVTFLVIILSVNYTFLRYSNGQPKTWIKAGYWYVGSDFLARDINSELFTHLICSFADLDSSFYTVSISPVYNQSISTFTENVRIKNPGVTTLLSIWAGGRDSSLFFNMASSPLRRRSFIMSSIQIARLHSFGGVDLFWTDPASGANATTMAAFFFEWRAAADADARATNKSRLLLTMAVTYLPIIGGAAYPIHSIRKNLDWVNIIAYDYYTPTKDNFTGAHAALYNPSSHVNTDYGLKKWVNEGGMPASKVLLGLPYHGYAWTLATPAKGSSGVGVRASGTAITKDGSISYSLIKWFEKNNQGNFVYNSTYVQNFYTFSSTWIVYDDIEAIRTKVAYAKNKGLLGYCVFQVSNDDKWVLSKAAAQNHIKDNRNKWRWLMIGVPSVLLGILLLFCLMFYLRRAPHKSNGLIDLDDEEPLGASTNPRNNGDPLLRGFHFVNIEAATDNFSIENKLGEGGYGTVYKGKLRRGKEIAVKRLSKSSEQGVEEFTNEVTLTAKLQHVNLVKLLGFCVERGEKMLIYEYMPNRSLDLYLYDPAQRSLLDWEKFVEIIQGIIQGLLYLQEYSRLTIIHRDLKASNILLDEHMKPKIADFGMARVFQKGEHEANTERIVGTYGYVPPEYAKRGIYSTKSDVYSFGVLLLQIISGRRSSCFYGPFENLNLLEYAYEVWRDGKWCEFVDGSLDDSFCECKLANCMQVALLCVQERGEDRPSMVQVFSMLKSETADAIPAPKKPAFSTQIKDDDEMCSNHVSITKIVAR